MKRNQTTLSANHPFHRLVHLCNGDKATAKRLLHGLAPKHSDKTLEWLCEKAIADLMRDRQRG